MAAASQEQAQEEAQEEPLIARGDGAPSRFDSATALKYGSLVLVIFQNSAHVLLLRYTRVAGGDCSLYTTSVVILFAEIIKLVFCVLALCCTNGGPVRCCIELKEQIWERKFDTLKVGVPSFCYTLQNNLQFIAATHLTAALLQLLYQMKTLTTAVFGVIILGRSLRCNQWLALTILVAGVICAQSSQEAAERLGRSKNVMAGITAALGVSVCSGFASVYLEKILKGDKTPLLVRNVQLCIFSIPLQLVAIYQRDYHKVLRHGWMHGFCLSTWALTVMFALGGLLVAVVIRFADNNLKNLAMAVAIILSCAVAVPLFGFVPNRVFAAGGALVIASIFLYAWQPKPKPAFVSPTSDVEVTPAKPAQGA